MDRELTLEIVRVTESAAICAAQQMGRGDEKAADQKAVDAMRLALNNLHISGTVVIGEGERDEAPMLYIGEQVGKGGQKLDIALDPLEGTTITAQGGPNALSVIAMADHGGFLYAPDVYMQKIAAAPGVSESALDIDAPIAQNIHNVAREKNVPVSNLTVCVLNRPRHSEIIQDIRKVGARINLISDGDVSAVIATTQPDSGIDLYVGTGGAPEGVLAAAALRCTGGVFQGRLLLETDRQKERATEYGIKDYNKIYALHELAKGDVMFAATGVTTGAMLEGVKYSAQGISTESIVMRSKTKTIRTICTQHAFCHDNTLVNQHDKSKVVCSGF